MGTQGGQKSKFLLKMTLDIDIMPKSLQFGSLDVTHKNYKIAFRLNLDAIYSISIA